jgi:hypothetical protein
MAGAIFVKPGETVTVVGVPATAPVPPYVPGPVDPGYSPPWAQVPPGGQGGGPVDPGYFPPGVGGPGSRPPVDGSRVPRREEDSRRQRQCIGPRRSRTPNT